MKRYQKMILMLTMVLAAQVCSAQTQQQEPDANISIGTVAAIGYPVGGGVKVVMGGTPAAAQASGEAKVNAKKGGAVIQLKVAGMPQPTSLGPEFLTYVLWTVTPDGTTANLGEIPVNQNGEGSLQVSAQSQIFAMIVTAEPYYAVRLPSDLIVLQNETGKSTKGKVYPNNSYKLMKRSEYAKEGNPLALTPDLKKVPLVIYEARNAIEIAKSRGAEQNAAEVFSKAQASMQSAENALSQGANKNQVISAARQTIQFAEDARSLAVQREEAARIEREKADAAAVAAANAKSKANAQAAAEAQRQAELTAAKEAQMKAEAAAQSAEAAARQQALQAKEEAARQDAARAKAATEALRAQLLQQLNDVLQTTDSPRGLVVNMADVLFETGKYALAPEAQLKLAKLSGIIQAHPGLNLAIEGHTDTTGTAEFNMTLSQQRADAVRQFLIMQGLSPDTITATGVGEAGPIADNSTAAGRKQNRRVEIIVSGEVIGTKIGN